MRNKSSGQEAIEFILIVVLVFFAAFITISVFGNKVAAFFERDSAVVKASQNKAPASSDIQTYNNNDFNFDPSTISSTSSVYGVSIPDLDSSVTEAINLIPDSISQTIESTGSSGTTDELVAALEVIAASLKEAAETNPELQVLSDKVYALAEAGYLVSDAESIIESLLKRADGKYQDIYITDEDPDNRLCLDHTKLASQSSNCERRIDYNDSFYYFYDRNSGRLDKYINQFITLKNDVDAAGSTSELINKYPDVQNALNIINAMSSDIIHISDKFQAEYEKIAANPPPSLIETLKTKVASTTTDTKSDKIKHEGQTIETVENLDNSTTP